jgi:hypothetical protein
MVYGVATSPADTNYLDHRTLAVGIHKFKHLLSPRRRFLVGLRAAWLKNKKSLKITL